MNTAIPAKNHKKFVLWRTFCSIFPIFNSFELFEKSVFLHFGLNNLKTLLQNSASHKLLESNFRINPPTCWANMHGTKNILNLCVEKYITIKIFSNIVQKFCVSLFYLQMNKLVKKIKTENTHWKVMTMKLKKYITGRVSSSL